MEEPWSAMGAGGLEHPAAYNALGVKNKFIENIMLTAKPHRFQSNIQKSRHENKKSLMQGTHRQHNFITIVEEGFIAFILFASAVIFRFSTQFWRQLSLYCRSSLQLLPVIDKINMKNNRGGFPIAESLKI